MRLQVIAGQISALSLFTAQVRQFASTAAVALTLVETESFGAISIESFRDDGEDMTGATDGQVAGDLMARLGVRLRVR